MEQISIPLARPIWNNHLNLRHLPISTCAPVDGAGPIIKAFEDEEGHSRKVLCCLTDLWTHKPWRLPILRLWLWELLDVPCLALHSFRSPILSVDQVYQTFLFTVFPRCLYSGPLADSCSGKTTGTGVLVHQSRLVYSAIPFCTMGAGPFLEPLVVVVLLFGRT